jgi:hypothetical protein
MPSRYANRIIFHNFEEIYRDYLEDRGLKFARQYVSPKFGKITQESYNKLDVDQKQWVIGDRLSKLAGKYYGSSKYWWVIAYFNQKPTEAHFKIGDTVYIPTSLEAALKLFKGR